MVNIAVGERPSLIRFHYFWYSAAAIAAMIAAITSSDLWFLNFVHVFSGLMWTGIDLFMGFVVGPILGRLALPAKREILTRLIPRTLFLMPTLSIIGGTSGWFLAQDLGYLSIPWPGFGWVPAAFIITTVLTLQGIGYLLPTNLRICLELQRSDPDPDKLARWSRGYFMVIASQGVMQVLIVIIMARFATGI